ncbi:unnamed protein product, partial [Rotaria magnacalcarata]
MMTTNYSDLYDEQEEEDEQHETLQYFDKMPNDLPWNMNDKIKSQEKITEIEEQNLSERISQLSTNTTNEKEPIMIMKEIKDQLEMIPNYLTKKNKAFKEMVHQTLSSTTTTTEEKSNNNANELRRIAILIYKIMVIQSYRYLWKNYLKSGTGQLFIRSKTEQKLFYSITLPIWPKEIKTIVLSNTKNKINENDICLKLVNDQLYGMQHQLNKYEKELNIQATNVEGYSPSIHKIIMKYVEQNLNLSFHRKIVHQVNLIHYDYHIRALELEYFRHKPNQYQKKLMAEICQSKYEQETSEQEYGFLKEQISYYNLPSQSLTCSNIFNGPLFNSIQNIPLREELIQKCKDVAEQGRNNLFNIYFRSAEDQREEYKKKHEINVKKMNESQYTLNQNEKLSSILIQLINERCNKIGERIQCIYKFNQNNVKIIYLLMMDVNNMDRQDNVAISIQEPLKEKKCHGNRRNQRFRRKCRAEKMNPAKIKKLVKKRNRFYNKNKKKKSNEESTKLKGGLAPAGKNYQTQSILQTTTSFNKRKRDISSQQISSKITNQTIIPKSTSSISILQSSSKKMKNISAIMNDDTIINENNNDINKHINYRQPMYLTRSSSILCQILNKALNYSLKKEDEKEFIFQRLQLLDQQYCLEMDRQLWQSYLDIGIQQNFWPDQLYTMAKTNDFDLCKQYVTNYIENNKKQLNHCQFELTKQEQQFQTCSIKELSFEQMEQRLKELVDRERKYLSKRNNNKLTKFKDDISGKQLLKTMSTASLMKNQPTEHINQLTTIREKQAKIWKEQLMLETRISCKFLPETFGQLDHYITSTDYLPLNNDTKIIEIKNKRYKTIQETKRQWLNYFLNIYEIEIQEYEQQYQNEFIKLESLFSTNNNDNMIN